MKVELTKEQSELLRAHASFITTINPMNIYPETWAYIPTWFKFSPLEEKPYVDFNNVELFSFEKLPTYVLDTVKKMNNIPTKQLCQKCGKEGFFEVYSQGDRFFHCCEECVTDNNKNIMLIRK